ncbi:terpene synthase-like isoform X2 [Temnothorax americanus]|uniref:terpene synthase-like isoform X2 n=1 Tax=Temnothorax americanus TaxID=1964332 RepID=UPI00406827AF
MTDSRKVIPFYYSPSGDTEEDKKLLELFEYVIRCTEKHRCTKLTLAFNYGLKISPDKLRQIDEIISIVYNVCILAQRMHMHWKANSMCPTDYKTNINQLYRGWPAGQADGKTNETVFHL